MQVAIVGLHGLTVCSQATLGPDRGLVPASMSPVALATEWRCQSPWHVDDGLPVKFVVSLLRTVQ